MGDKKYLPSNRCPLVRPVRMLHGLPWGTGPLETGLASPHFFLPDGGSGGRPGRRVGGFSRSPRFPRFLGIPARLVALRAAPVHGARAGQEFVAPLQPVGPAGYCCGGWVTARGPPGGVACAPRAPRRVRVADRALCAPPFGARWV